MTDQDVDFDAELELATLLSSLQVSREPVASEMDVLQSIYGPDSICVWRPPPNSEGQSDSESIRYEIRLTLPAHEDVTLRLLASLPPDYPSTRPPQLQLHSRYIGSFSIDSALLGSVLRTYTTQLEGGIEFTPDVVCVFDGVQSVLDRCNDWYEDKLSQAAAGGLAREEEKAVHSPEGEPLTQVRKQAPSAPAAMPEGIEFYIAEPIVDRKSSFIGRACHISDPSQVPLILDHLMSDHRIARAAHPIINAWRCQVGTLLHQDNDDDGETAAGGRLAHLLQILEVNNVLVIVTRYFGGIHLGPDRFKHINQAARNALELGGFLDGVNPKKSVGRKK